MILRALPSNKYGNISLTILFLFVAECLLHKFSYPNLNREVRNYHPLMGSTRYDITLFEPKLPCYEVMGLIAPSIHIPLPFSTLSFQPSNNKLDSKNEAFLSDLATIIKENPTEAFIIKPFYKSNKPRAVKIGKLINSFFVDKQGIGQERIFLIDPQLRKSNSAEVIIEFAPKERN